MRNNVMLDLETLGTGVFPVVLSIGAVKFDPRGTWVEEPGGPTTDQSSFHFYQRISPASCLQLGGQFDDRAFNWWMQPEQAEARQYSLGGPEIVSGPAVHINDALEAFAKWCAASEAAVDLRADHIWSHGLTFDVSIAQHYFERLQLQWPFHYRKARDTRTLYDLCGLNADGENSIAFPPAKVPHHPAWDAWRQARAVQSCYGLLSTHLSARLDAVAEERRQCAAAALDAKSPSDATFTTEECAAFLMGKSCAADAIQARK